MSINKLNSLKKTKVCGELIEIYIKSLKYFKIKIE